MSSGGEEKGWDLNGKSVLVVAMASQTCTEALSCTPPGLRGEFPGQWAMEEGWRNSPEADIIVTLATHKINVCNFLLAFVPFWYVRGAEPFGRLWGKLMTH
jgi:hypothetical protein